MSQQKLTIVPIILDREKLEDCIKTGEIMTLPNELRYFSLIAQMEIELSCSKNKQFCLDI
jgi:hypothetical protein